VKKISFGKDPIVSFALEEFERRVNDKSNAIHEASAALKQRWSDQLIQTLSEITQSENPFMKMREILCDAVVRASYFSVLMKHNVDKNGNAISHPKITWRLSDHIYMRSLKRTENSKRF
jgi:hypothetical protein